jgi:hypothetical protein
LNVSEQYTKEIRQELKYSATWLPNVYLSLGDVGIFQNYQYYPKGNLSDFGIRFDVSPAASPADFDYASRDSVSVQVKLKGDAPLVGSNLAEADAGVSIKFGRQNAILFTATRCRSSRIRDLNKLGKQINDKHRKGEWDKELAIITQVIKAQGATVIISRGSNSQIDLSAKGKVGTGNTNLADITADLKIIHRNNIGTSIVAKPNLTPLFEAWGLKLTLSGRHLRPVRKPDQLEFKNVDYEDYASK